MTRNFNHFIKYQRILIFFGFLLKIIPEFKKILTFFIKQTPGWTGAGDCFLLAPLARKGAEIKPSWRNGRRHGLKIRCWATSVGVRVPPAALLFPMGS
jgi:hypothetical protein